MVEAGLKEEAELKEEAGMVLPVVWMVSGDGEKVKGREVSWETEQASGEEGELRMSLLMVATACHGL